jgi:hypothetical protein
LVDRKIIYAGHGPNAGNQHRQRIRISAEQRKLADLPPADDTADCVGLGVEENSRRGDFDDFGCRADLEGEIQNSDLLDLEFEASLSHGGETGFEDGNVEDARGKPRDGVEAFGTRFDGHGDAGGSSSGGDAGVRNHCPAWIQDAAGEHGALRERERLENEDTDG